MGRFAEKTVLITGATGGIGRAAAILFAREGARLLLTGRRTEEGEKTVALVREAGGEAMFFAGDVASAADCETMVRKAVELGGKLDIAINNASIVKTGTFTADMEEADWDALMAINLKGVFLSMKYEIPAMLAASGGVIVNISSVGGVIGTAGIAAYCTSKHGVIGLTRSAALEYVSRGIRINALCPAGTDTDMLNTWLGEPEVRAAVLAQIPIGRLASPEEMARSVLALASAEMSYMVGQAVVVDGGLTAY